jgi:protein-disulfide isomerase
MSGSKAKSRSRSRQARPPARKPSRGNRAARRRGERQPWWQRPQAIVGLIAIVVVGGILIQAFRSSPSVSGKVVRPSGVAADGGVAKGASSATVTVEEYGDFQCPHCGDFQRTVGPTIERLVSDGTIRFTYVPLAFIGEESSLASNAAYCAGNQGKFWEYHDHLFAHQAAENSGALTSTSLTSFGAAVGVTGDAFASCVKDETYVPFVSHITDLASQRGVNQTPTLYINGSQAPPSAYTAEGFAAAVEAAAAG